MSWFSKALVACVFCFQASLSAAAIWGHHLILDCKGGHIDRINDAEVLRSFVKTLVEEIDMKAYGEPLLEYFAEHTPEAAGYSLVQLIETSAITGHFAAINGDFYLDIFSCKYFDPEKAKKVVEEFFHPQRIKSVFLDRQA